MFWDPSNQAQLMKIEASAADVAQVCRVWEYVSGV